MCTHLSSPLVAAHEVVDRPLACLACIVCEACDDDAVQEVCREVGGGAPLGDELISEGGEVDASVCWCAECDQEDLGQGLVLGLLLLAGGGCHLDGESPHHRVDTVNDLYVDVQ